MDSVRLLVQARAASLRGPGSRGFAWLLYLMAVTVVMMSIVAGDITREVVRSGQPGPVRDVALNLLKTFTNPGQGAWWISVVMGVSLLVLTVSAFASPSPGRLLDGHLLRVPAVHRVTESALTFGASLAPLLSLAAILTCMSLITVDTSRRGLMMLLGVGAWLAIMGMSLWVLWMRELTRVAGFTRFTTHDAVTAACVVGTPLVLWFTCLSSPGFGGPFNVAAYGALMVMLAVASLRSTVSVATRAVNTPAPPRTSPIRRPYAGDRGVTRTLMIMVGRQIARTRAVSTPALVLSVSVITVAVVTGPASTGFVFLPAALCVVWSVCYTANGLALSGRSAHWMASLPGTGRGLFLAHLAWSALVPGVATALGAAVVLLAHPGSAGALSANLATWWVTCTAVTGVALVWSIVGSHRVAIKLGAPLMGPAASLVCLIVLAGVAAGSSLSVTHLGAWALPVWTAGGGAVLGVTYMVWRRHFTFILGKAGS